MDKNVLIAVAKAAIKIRDNKTIGHAPVFYEIRRALMKIEDGHK